MTVNPFSWLRTLARNAVLGGVGDAMIELAPADAGAPPMTLDDLRARLAIAPAAEPEAVEETTKAGGRKGRGA